MDVLAPIVGQPAITDQQVGLYANLKSSYEGFRRASDFEVLYCSVFDFAVVVQFGVCGPLDVLAPIVGQPAITAGPFVDPTTTAAQVSYHSHRLVAIVLIAAPAQFSCPRLLLTLTDCLSCALFLSQTSNLVDRDPFP